MIPPRAITIQLWCAVGVLLIVGLQEGRGFTFFHRRQQSDDTTDDNDFIFPGTLWCGPGNISETPDDLGEFKDTDACCREHDNCPELIHAGGSKYGLVNNATYTRVHCLCDDAFHSCLSSVDTVPSNQVGRIYFTLLNTQCFRLDYPAVDCKTYHPTVRWRCEQYEYNKTVDKLWQWFDVPVY